MKKELIQDMLTQIDDKYILESHPDTVLAARREQEERTGGRRRRQDLGGAGWSRSGVVAAILSVVVSLAVLGGVIAAGRMGSESSPPSVTDDLLHAAGTASPELDAPATDASVDAEPAEPALPAEPGSLTPAEAETAILDYLTGRLELMLAPDTGEGFGLFTGRYFRFTEVSGRWQDDEGSHGFDYTSEPLPTDGEALIRRLKEEGFIFHEVLCSEKDTLALYLTDPAGNLQFSGQEVEASFRAYNRDSGRELTTRATPFTELSTLSDSGVYEILVVLTVSFGEAELNGYDLKYVTLQAPFLLFFEESVGGDSSTSGTDDLHVIRYSSGREDLTRALTTPYPLWESGITVGPDGEELAYDSRETGALELILQEDLTHLQEESLRIYNESGAALKIRLYRPNSYISAITVIDARTLQETYGQVVTEGSKPTSTTIPIEELYVQYDCPDAYYLVIRVAYDDGTTRGECEYPVFIVLSPEEYADETTSPTYTPETEHPIP